MVRIVEIGLTTLLFAVPSSVLAGSMGPYDEPKVWALLTLVGLTGLVWLLGRALGLRPALPPPDRALRVVRWMLVAYALWFGLATVLSVAPGQSLWGAFGRGFGLAAFLAALVLFAIVQAEFRTLERAGQLVDRALIGSLPVVAIGVGQALGWDPFPAHWDPATAGLRVFSTFGQHIFYGSYLVVLVPLAIGRVVTARSGHEGLQGGRGIVGAVWALGTIGLLAWGRQGAAAWWAGLAWSLAGAVAWSTASSLSRASLPPVVRLAMLGGLAAAQTLTLVLSTARGALVGLLAGLFVATAVLLVVRRATKTLAILGAGLLAIVLFLGILNVRGSPLEPLREIRLFRRLGSITEMRITAPGGVRVRLWKGILARWPGQLAGNGVVPALPPVLRAAVGYGPETQILVLDRFLPEEMKRLGAKRRSGWASRYTFDRAHNELLDHLVTTGLVGAVLWIGVASSVIATGVVRLRAAAGTAEAGMRLGCLAVVIGQVVEGLVGIASPLPRALFWMAAALLTLPHPMAPALPPGSLRGSRQAAIRQHLSWPSLASLAGALVLVGFVVAGSSRWWLSSMAYARGIQDGVARDLPMARREFVRASQLAPWIPFPAEAVADVSLRVPDTGLDQATRAAWLDEAQDVLARARQYVPSRHELWRLSAQVAQARAALGSPEKLREALRSFAEAARLRSRDADTLAEWALAQLQSGDPATARRLAEEALASDQDAWLAWAVLAKSSQKLGDSERARQGAEQARRLAPEASRSAVESIVQ